MFFSTIAEAEAAVTEVTITPEELAASEAFDINVPSSALVKLNAQEITSSSFNENIQAPATAALRFGGRRSESVDTDVDTRRNHIYIQFFFEFNDPNNISWLFDGVRDSSIIQDLNLSFEIEVDFDFELSVDRDDIEESGETLDDFFDDLF